MKQARLIALTTAITFSIFAAVIVSSCKKTDACSNVTCQNGGTCVNGKCSCPTGYTGNFCETAAQSSITYVNNTYTTMLITVNDVQSKLQVNSSVTYPGTPGKTVTVNATTAYTTATGQITGEVVTWSFIDTLPASGAITHTLNVDPTYFYLSIANGDNYDSIVAINVNYQTSYQTTDSITLPNNGVPYIIGYFRAFPDTKIYVAGRGQSLTGSSWILTPTIPNTVNAAATVSVP